MLIEMSSEGVSRMIKSLISSADKASSLDDVMPVVKSWGSEVLVNGMDFIALKRINWSNGMLPDVTYNIIETVCVKHVDWIW